MSDRVAEIEERVAALEFMLKQQPINPDLLYMPTEVAAWLRCSKTNVYDLMSRGELATTRIGAGNGGMRVRGSDILAFLDDRKEGSPSRKSTRKFLSF